LYFVLHASEELFHTGWFLESLITQTLVIHIIRTNKRPFIESRPSKFLISMSILIVLIGLIIPFSGISGALGFVPPPPIFFVYIFGIVVVYLIMVQFVKVWFVRKYGHE
jgi:Mg2+-importing ATPase